MSAGTVERCGWIRIVGGEEDACNRPAPYLRHEPLTEFGPITEPACEWHRGGDMALVNATAKVGADFPAVGAFLAAGAVMA